MIGREQSPALACLQIAGDIQAELSVVDAVLKGCIAPSEGPRGQIELTRVVVEPVFHADDDGAPQRVETVDGVGADDVDARNGKIGHEIPIDRVAEGLIDAHAILVDREAFRRAEHGRRLEAAIKDVRLKRIVEIVIDVDRTQPVV